jgi:hypothetical protein
MLPCAALQAYTYELHARFGHLCSNELPARLQLAALYAATGSLLPEPASQLTGAQQAMQLVRQCWGTRPLGQAGPQQLVDIARLGGHMAAGLRLLSLSSLPAPPNSTTCITQTGRQNMLSRQWWTQTGGQLTFRSVASARPAAAVGTPACC